MIDAEQTGDVGPQEYLAIDALLGVHCAVGNRPFHLADHGQFD